MLKRFFVFSAFPCSLKSLFVLVLKASRLRLLIIRLRLDDGEYIQSVISTWSTCIPNLIKDVKRIHTYTHTHTHTRTNTHLCTSKKVENEFGNSSSLYIGTYSQSLYRNYRSFYGTFFLRNPFSF